MSLLDHTKSCDNGQLYKRSRERKRSRSRRSRRRNRSRSRRSRRKVWANAVNERS